MAENKAAETKEPKAETKGKKKEEGKERETPQERTKRQEKQSRWNLETCVRVAKRFETREEWEHGAPSCFKAATAHGWMTQCMAHMKGGTKVLKKPVEKIVAKTKKPAPRLPKSA